MDVIQFQQTEWFKVLESDLRAELTLLLESRHDSQADRTSEIESIRRKQQGWKQSLADPDLAPSIRTEIQQEWANANQQQMELEKLQFERRSVHDSIERVLTPAAILDRLRRLPEVFAASNPSRTNLELALHIDRIECWSDGKVVMRTCRLGALTHAVPLLSKVATDDVSTSSTEGPRGRRGPRRRRRLKVDAAGPERRELVATADFVTDPERFAGLPETWFWHDEFQRPVKLSWAAEHSEEVARARISGMTHEELAEQFGKTVPTIRKALKYAKADPELAAKLVAAPRRMPRERWHEVHADEVLQSFERLKIETGTKVTPMASLVQKFQKSDVTIRKALEHARQHRQVSANSLSSLD